MVESQEEMSVRVRKGGFVANLFLRSSFRPNALFETSYIYIYIYIYGPTEGALNAESPKRTF